MNRYGMIRRTIRRRARSPTLEITAFSCVMLFIGHPIASTRGVFNLPVLMRGSSPARKLRARLTSAEPPPPSRNSPRHAPLEGHLETATKPLRRNRHEPGKPEGIGGHNQPDDDCQNDAMFEDRPEYSCFIANLQGRRARDHDRL